MIKKMEESFAAQFRQCLLWKYLPARWGLTHCAQPARGGLRQALKHLRAAPFHHSHHFSTFRSGVLLGSSVPALIAGLSRCMFSSATFRKTLPHSSSVCAGFQETTRAAIPGWDGLLIVYAVFMIPVVSALLIGLNLLVWSHFQINYPFIFGLFLSLMYGAQSAHSEAQI
jgi:hypothetical protein